MGCSSHASGARKKGVPTFDFFFVEWDESCMFEELFYESSGDVVAPNMTS
jgi:hypothetical protein